MDDADRKRQIGELSAIARDCPRCSDCHGFYVAIDSPAADFNHRAAAGSNAVAACCGRGVELSPEDLLRCRRAESAWDEKNRLEREFPEVRR